jgi:hypothetical protein
MVRYRVGVYKEWHTTAVCAAVWMSLFSRSSMDESSPSWVGKRSRAHKLPLQV